MALKLIVTIIGLTIAIIVLLIPVDLFEFEDFDDEFKKCWNLKNLRFLEGDKNLNKKNKLDKSLIIEYNIENLLPKGVKFENL